MGMLFNTPGTTRILHLLNDTFRRGQFGRIATNPPTGFIADLQSLSPAKGIHRYGCTPLRLDDWDAGVHGNWRTFLNILDNAASPGVFTPPNTANPTISGEIGKAIAAALLGNIAPWQNISSVEFFAVPTSTAVPSLNIMRYTDSSREDTMIITITTTTYDQAAPM